MLSVHDDDRHRLVLSILFIAFKFSIDSAATSPLNMPLDLDVDIESLVAGVSSDLNRFKDEGVNVSLH